MQKKHRFKVNGILAALAMILMVAAGAEAASSKVLYKFKGGDNGGHPYAGLILDTAGNLYGTTFEGGGSTCGYGDDPCGSVFRLTRNSNGSWTETVLHRFAGGSDGWSTYAGLTLDGDGNLYGTSVVGGGCHGLQFGCGTVFKLTPHSDGSWTESVLYSFCQLANCADGLEPYGGLIFDGAGNLYGTTATGGASGGGVVFKLTPNSDGSWTETVLQTLGGDHGGGPYASLIFDAAGNLYGTTSGGGVRSGDVGTVFELVPNSDGSWTEHILHLFTGGKDGAAPYAGLIFDVAGNLYGTTAEGGGDGNGGTVFQLTLGSNGKWVESILSRFSPGANPYAGLAFDTAGNLYGTTVHGSSANEGLLSNSRPGRMGAGCTAYSSLLRVLRL
jgi:uncharacterized repeat protein (TIGR03803 family)